MASTVYDQIYEARRIRIIGDSVLDSISSKTPQDIYLLPESQGKINKYAIATASLKWVLLPATDPFAISFKEFETLSPDESEKLIRAAYELNKGIIKDAWAKGNRQIILCQNKIVFKTQEDEPISSEVIEKLAKKYNSACYVFSAPDKVEESAWTPISRDDSYPTLKIYLGKADSNEDEIIEHSSPILADFDTGNPSLKVFNSSLLPEELKEFRPFDVREGEHLGQQYTYYNKRVKICVKDINGKTSSHVCFIRMIREWNNCALLQASPNRVGFVGRDLAKALRMRLKIDAVKRITQILDVS